MLGGHITAVNLKSSYSRSRPLVVFYVRRVLKLKKARNEKKNSAALEVLGLFFPLPPTKTNLVVEIRRMLLFTDIPEKIPLCPEM